MRGLTAVACVAPAAGKTPFASLAFRLRGTVWYVGRSVEMSLSALFAGVAFSVAAAVSFLFGGVAPGCLLSTVLGGHRGTCLMGTELVFRRVPSTHVVVARSVVREMRFSGLHNVSPCEYASASTKQ